MTAPIASTPSTARRRPALRLDPTTMVFGAWVAVLVVGGILVAIDGGNLFSQANTTKMLRGMSLLGFVAIGQTMVVVCRSLDLSVGYVVAWSSLVGATAMRGEDGRIVVGIVFALGVAALVGLVNGIAITVLRVNAFIATLGVGLILQGYIDTTYRGPSGEVPDSFLDFGFARVWVIPISTIVMVAVAVVATFVLRRTALGHAMFAVGGNDEVARYAGIRTRRTLITAHVMCSVAAGIAGLLTAARFGQGDPRVYDDGFDLDSIAAVVLGGTLLLGGRGSVAGTVAGVGTLAALDTVFDALQVDPFFKDVVRGAVIIIAVALYARRQVDRRSSRQRFTSSARTLFGRSHDAHPTTSAPDTVSTGSIR
jgi:ribose transport system permease protein